MVSRLATAAVLAPLALGAVWLLPTAALAVLLAVVAGLGWWEWTRLSGLTEPRLRAATAGLFLLSLGPGAWLLAAEGAVPVLAAVVAAWLALGAWVLAHARRPAPALPPWLSAAAGWLVLWSSWLAVVYLHGFEDAGPFWVTFLLVVVWGADTGAYLAGRAFGRHRLAPAVSPGKTWEGVAGGVLAGLAGGGVLVLLLDPTGPPLLLLAVLAAATVALSVIGDLFESLIKRQRGIKDSGGLLPGHGGVLDRIDSLTAAAPALATGLAAWKAAL